MHQQLIFAPMGALALLTFTVLGQVPQPQFSTTAAGQIKADDFKYGESAAVPGHVSIPNRNYMSLLELPTLFYVASLMFFVTNKVDAIAIAVAWIYVGLRIVHSVIHLTYNRVMHRLVPFALSNFVLMGYWAPVLPALRAERPDRRLSRDALSQAQASSPGSRLVEVVETQVGPAVIARCRSSVEAPPCGQVSHVDMFKRSLAVELDHGARCVSQPSEGESAILPGHPSSENPSLDAEVWPAASAESS